MFAPGFGKETMEVADFPAGPAWLARHHVEDPRFALAVVQRFFEGLTGQAPLPYPTDPTAADASARLGAWEAQDATLRAIAAAYTKDKENARTVVRAILLSPYFRASGIDAKAKPEDVARLAGIGTARLSTP